MPWADVGWRVLETIDEDEAGSSHRHPAPSSLDRFGREHAGEDGHRCLSVPSLHRLVLVLMPHLVFPKKALLGSSEGSTFGPVAGERKTDGLGDPQQARETEGLFCDLAPRAGSHS